MQRMFQPMQRAKLTFFPLASYRDKSGDRNARQSRMNTRNENGAPHKQSDGEIRRKMTDAEPIQGQERC